MKIQMVANKALNLSDSKHVKFSSENNNTVQFKAQNGIKEQGLSQQEAKKKGFINGVVFMLIWGIADWTANWFLDKKAKKDLEGIVKAPTISDTDIEEIAKVGLEPISLNANDIKVPSKSVVAEKYIPGVSVVKKLCKTIK